MVSARSVFLKYLPAIYQEDPESRSFLARFLSILQTDFDGFDETIDDIWNYFDAASVPADWFLWLAAWIALPIEPELDRHAEAVGIEKCRSAVSPPRDGGRAAAAHLRLCRRRHSPVREFSPARAYCYSRRIRRKLYRPEGADCGVAITIGGFKSGSIAASGISSSSVIRSPASRRSPGRA